MQKGRLTVITGPMFAGKTQKLLGEIELAGRAGLRFQVIKPRKDTRTPGRVESRNGVWRPAAEMPDDGEFDIPVNTQVMFIDEGHMFGQYLFRTVAMALVAGTDVVVAGVDYNCLTKPFLTMSKLIAECDLLVRCFSNCYNCRELAPYTKRSGSTVEEIVVGSDIYKPICYNCLALEPEDGLWLVL